MRNLIAALAPLFIFALPVSAPAAVRDPDGQMNRAYTYLYVTDPTVNKVEVLNPSYKLVKTFTTGLSQPEGDAVDSLGNLYVANANNCAGGGNVAEFARGAASPTFIYSAGLYCPESVATNGAGDVFVFDEGSNGNFLAEFKRGTDKIINTWSTCNLTLYTVCYPTGIAMGTMGRLYLTMWGDLPGSFHGWWVADEVFYKLKSNNQGYVFGTSNPAGGTAVDSHANILVGAYPVPGGGGSPAGSIYTIVKLPYPYHGSDWQPKDLGYIGFSFVTGLALSADQKALYAADNGGATLTVLTYPKGTFVKSLGSASGLTDPYGVAIGPAP